MKKYKVISITEPGDGILDKIFKKKIVKYNIRNTESGYNMYKHHYTLKTPATEYCEQLNNYNEAEKFIICQDGNGIYHVLYKTNRATGVITINGVEYNNIVNLGYFHELEKVKEGYKTIEAARTLKKRAYEKYTKNENGKTFKFIE